MIKQCVTKKMAGELIGVSLRQITKYLTSKELTSHHIEKGKVMIDIAEVYDLRERKRGKIK